MIEPDHIKVIMLGESHEVAAPLGLLRADQAVIVRPSDTLSVLL